MDQHRMQRMPQWFAFERIFQHGSYSSGTFAPPASAILRHFFLDMRATLMPY